MFLKNERQSMNLKKIKTMLFVRCFIRDFIHSLHEVMTPELSLR